MVLVRHHGCVLFRSSVCHEDVDHSCESCLFVLITQTRCAILKMTRNILGLENRRPYYR